MGRDGAMEVLATNRDAALVDVRGPLHGRGRDFDVAFAHGEKAGEWHPVALVLGEKTDRERKRGGEERRRRMWMVP